MSSGVAQSWPAQPVLMAQMVDERHWFEQLLDALLLHA